MGSNPYSFGSTFLHLFGGDIICVCESEKLADAKIVLATKDGDCICLRASLTPNKNEWRKINGKEEQEEVQRPQYSKHIGSGKASAGQVMV